MKKYLPQASPVTVHSLENGPDRVLSRADAVGRRVILFVHRPENNSIALVVADKRAGKLHKILGVTTIGEKGLAELDQAFFAAKRAAAAATLEHT